MEKKIWGDFEILEELGEGGMGIVYKARQVSLDRPVAVKALSLDFAGQNEFIERFNREAKAVAKLNHPNIVQVYGAGQTDDGRCYFAMEYLEGQDLSAKLERGDVISDSERLRMVKEAALALSAAHEQDIIHRDIKPSNLMITKKGTVKVMDFGLAKSLTADANLTRTGVVMGTVNYISPEQGEGQEVDRRTDIYSLGIVLFQLMTGTVPFKGNTPSAIIYQHVHAQAPQPRKLKPGLTAAVENVILKAIAKKPADRFQSMQEFADAIESASSADFAPAEATAVMGDSLPPAGDSVPPAAMPAPPAPKKSAWKVGLAVAGGFLILAALGAFAVNSVLHKPPIEVKDITEPAPVHAPISRVTEPAGIPAPAATPDEKQQVAKLTEPVKLLQPPVQTGPTEKDITLLKSLFAEPQPEPVSKDKPVIVVSMEGLAEVIWVDTSNEIENQIESDLVAKGITVIDERQFANLSGLQAAVSGGDYGKAAAFVRQNGADVLIHGKTTRRFSHESDLYGTKYAFYTWQIQLKAVATSDAQIIYSGSRQTEPSARNDELAEAAKELIPVMISKIGQDWKKHAARLETLDVAISNPEYQSYLAFETALKERAGVQSVTRRRFEGGKAIIRLHYSGDRASVLKQLADNSAALAEQDNTIELTLK